MLKAGGAYLPWIPPIRKRAWNSCLADAGAGLLLTEKNYRGLLGNYRGKVVCLDRLRRRAGNQDDNPTNQVTAANSAYVIYTSGSSGTPKGVLGLHRGAINRFSWMWKVYPFAGDEKNCQKTSLCFVDSIWEIFGALLHGVSTAIVPDAVAKEPQLLVR